MFRSRIIIRSIIAGCFAFCFFAACLDLSAAKLLTSPSVKTEKLCNGFVIVTASEWDCGVGIFAGSVYLQSISSIPEDIVVSITKDDSIFYRKKVTVDPGKSLRFSVYSPIISKSWFNCAVYVTDSYGNSFRWASFNKYYSWSKQEDIPLVRPRKTDALGDSYLDYLSISTLRLERTQWNRLPMEKKDAILNWVTLGGFLEISGVDGDKDSLRKDYPPMDFSRANFKGYGRGKLFEKKDFKEDYGSGCLLAGAGEFDPSPSWEVKLISPGLFIPAVMVFAMIIGPGAIFYSRRKKNPALVLALIPAISIISCVIILVLSIINDGVTPKICRQTVTFLDQPHDKALTQQIIGIEAPLGLNSPVEFPEDSIVVLSRKVSEASGGYCVAEDGTIKLYSFVQARIPAFFSMCRIEKRRERLEIKEEDGSIRVMNGLGCGIEKLLVRDSKGKFWYNEKIIPAGKEAVISKSVKEPILKEYAEYELMTLSISKLKKAGAPLGKGCYQAYLTKNVFGVDGIDSDRIIGDNYHLLVGRYRKAKN